MRVLGVALGIVAILTGCSHTGGTASLPNASQVPASGSSNFQVLHAFDKQKNGIVPDGSLVAVGGSLYGTTNFGGDPSKRCYPAWGCGTIFRFDAPSKQTVLYRFNGSADGTRPYAGLVNVKGVLYGTTQAGSKHNDGTVFSVTTSGAEHVIFAFSGKNGSDPRTNLTDINGVLYGTTYYGGSTETGTVFSVTTAGSERVLHSFKGGKDGALPLGALIEVNGVLYGTTVSGGTHNDGTVYAIDPDGTSYKVLYSFRGGADGRFPFSGVTALNGTLYGTTQLGGAHNKGTVYAITTSGSESVLHSFAGADGSEPYGGLTVLNGLLYGTTAYGGTAPGPNVTKKPKTEGTIFSITASGSEQVLHDFTGGPGGRVPYATLITMNGALYGTTIWGGNAKAKTGGTGTLFELTP